MSRVSGRKTVPGGNSFVIGQFPQALGILTVSVELSIKASLHGSPSSRLSLAAAFFYGAVGT